MASTEASLDDDVQSFRDCHLGIISALRELDALSRDDGQAAWRGQVASHVVTCHRESLLMHHQDEEQELFPAVLADARAGAEHDHVAAAIAQLTAEHRLIEARLQDLLPTLERIAAGRDAPLDRRLVDELVLCHLEHARIEEACFLPLAQIILERQGYHVAALGLSLHIRHASDEVRRRNGFI
jgi:hypothetical protein